MSRVVVLLLLCLAACQSGWEPAAKAVDLGQADACAAGIAANPAYAAIGRHMPLDGTPATAAQRDDTAIPAHAERSALRAWHEDLRQCRFLTVRAIGGFAPDEMAVLRDAHAYSDGYIVALIAGHASWGWANRARDAIAEAEWRRMWPIEATEADVRRAMAPPGAAAPPPISLAAGNR